MPPYAVYSIHLYSSYVMLYYTVGYNNYTTNNIGDKQNESKREDQHKERIKHY